MVTFRQAVKSDIPTLDLAISVDPYHKGWLLSDFFFHPLSMTVVGMDDDGPILFLRMKPVLKTVQIFAQFVCFDRLRAAKAIYEGFPTIKQHIALAGFHYIVIDSTSPSLVRLCVERLGFEPLPEPNYYSLNIQDSHE